MIEHLNYTQKKLINYYPEKNCFTISSYCCGDRVIRTKAHLSLLLQPSEYEIAKLSFKRKLTDFEVQEVSKFANIISVNKTNDNGTSTST